MEVGEVIVFGGLPYKIVRRLYKSRGGRNQTLSLWPDARTERNKAYYVVEREGRLFWVKEWDVKGSSLAERAEEEFKRLERVKNIRCERDGISVRAVNAYAFTNERLLIEHLQSYHKLRKGLVPPGRFIGIVKLVKEWLTVTGLGKTYDLCENNIMVGPDGDVVLIDFEIATGKPKL